VHGVHACTRGNARIREAEQKVGQSGGLEGAGGRGRGRGYEPHEILIDIRVTDFTGHAHPYGPPSGGVYPKRRTRSSTATSSFLLLFVMLICCQAEVSAQGCSTARCNKLPIRRALGNRSPSCARCSDRARARARGSMAALSLRLCAVAFL